MNKSLLDSYNLTYRQNDDTRTAKKKLKARVASSARRQIIATFVRIPR